MHETGAKAPPVEPSKDARLRWQVADRLRDRADSIGTAVADSLPQRGEPDADVVTLATALGRLVAEAARVGHCDARAGAVDGWTALVVRLGLDARQICALAYQGMTRAVEELASDPEVGATSAVWPLTSDMVRRATFDVLAAWATRAVDASSVSITDSLTTLHTRAMLDTVLLKECQRAERFEHWVSMLLIDVDHLSDINRVRGYGVGDQVLERVGILIRKYFRQHDWVARYSDDAVAVLLPETGPEDALTLANMMRTMVQERLTVDDERTSVRAAVTVSVAIASARPLNGHPIDAERVLQELDAAIERVKEGDRDGVEVVEIHPVVDTSGDTATDE